MENSPTNLEPQRKVSACAYCGDSPINHTLFYFVSLFGMTVDRHIMGVTRHAPDFAKNFVDWLTKVFFEILLAVGGAQLSPDINKAKTFRSKVVWEEAQRRGIKMEQVVMFGKYLDLYRAVINGKLVYFDSLPIPATKINMKKDWDDKFVLKNEFSKNDIPIPHYVQFPVFYPQNLEKIFSKLTPPVIVKPRVGSRGRHTITNIHTFDQFKKAVEISKQICSYLVAEEHLNGYVCRATLIDGKLMGFYRGGSPFVVGDGKKTITELILEKDKNRPERVEKILVNEELERHVERSGYKMTDILEPGIILPLTHRTGRLFGGVTKEMIDELHPSFIPILEKAASVVGLPVIGFDCIVPNPESDAGNQRWGIIECNSLPFIDLHYYALEGKPKNIAGAIWDMWK